jgi:glutaminyl-tRNA synthetase
MTATAPVNPGSNEVGEAGDVRPAPVDFIRAKVAADLKSGRYGGRVVTRFPPEPNGYLHIGHAKSCCLNFGLALENEGGVCHLRFDDTNPETEDIKYVESIQEDVRWLGFDWGDNLFHASDYFEQLYEFAVRLIKTGKAYVDSQSEEEIRKNRGTVLRPGEEGPYRDRSVEENLDLFESMRAGEFKDGEHVLRGKIDMAHPNMLMRDPLLYRIRHADHYRRGDEWCIYPLYDFTHCLSDAVEDITHSLCTLEFENNRALYDWALDAAGFEQPRPEQTEFARLDLDYTVLSKRKLIRLVEEGHVSGWDDPRIPTIAGLRRRGVTPEAIRGFCNMIGVDKVNSRVDIEKFEFAIRDDLNYRAPRVLAVLRPLKVVITNYPEDEVEWLDASYWPRDIPKEGSRKLPFAREIYIEQDDFREEPPKKFFRLAPGREVRLRYSYIIKCEEVVKDSATGAIVELRCTYDPDTLTGPPADGRKVKGTIHWVSAAHALPCEVRLYDRLFKVPDPDDVPEGQDFISNLNPNSLVVIQHSLIEPNVSDDPPGTCYQFERLGYFISDPVDSQPGALVFNRTVTLRDTWRKMVKINVQQTTGDVQRSGQRST